MYLNRAMRSDECPYDLHEIKILAFMILFSPSSKSGKFPLPLSSCSRAATGHCEPIMSLKNEKPTPIRMFYFRKRINYAYS